MSVKQKILAKSMIICDSVLQDIRTGKKSLISIFNKISSNQAPFQYPRLNIFIVLTEGNDEYDCELRCINSNTNQPIATLKGKMKFTDPNQIIEMNFELGPIIFPSFGQYRFEFIANGDLINSCPFEVAQNKQQRG